ncbi:hypothetical protein EDC20_1641 [Gluconobacter oxydans]|nr:hypothetical protein EDC20_1641 [Gluconobacter oxydans]
MTSNALARLREQVRCLERRSLPHSTLRALPTGLQPVDLRWSRPFGQFCGLDKLYPVVVMPPF